MTLTFVGGVLLVMLGLAGAADACVVHRGEPSLLVATLSGLSVAVGLVWMGIMGARHGYHRRPPGAPPGDTDPGKATDPVK
jgi:ribose/xylose/arabinose/galactoside ABC-type transport system permease subunit